MNRTIAAISTPAGTGGIAVIRISGEDAVKIADKVFFGSEKLSECDTHTVHYGFIKNEKGEKIDEVLVTVMRAPRTFTREDVVEISTEAVPLRAPYLTRLYTQARIWRRQVNLQNVRF